MSRSIQKNPRNLFASGVSMIALVIALVGVLFGSAFAESVRRHPLPQQQQGSRVPTKPTPPPRHETAFKTVPGTKLQIRAVQYDGSTNGTLTVQVKNPEKTQLTFNANGLYFVPEGDPDKAPQRLGAVGPMQIANGFGKETSSMAIAPGQTVELNLDVFCIDSHRSSPTPQNVFNIGATKLPKELTATIERRANDAVNHAKAEGAAAPRPAAKGRIQSEVWKSRDAKWVELDGEGDQEAGKK